MLEVIGVHKSFGEVTALAGVDLTIARSQVLALLGRNGAGKTTFAAIVAGLLTPDAGTVSVGGLDVAARTREARRLVGYVPQETGLYPTLTVRQNLRFFGRLNGVVARDVDRRLADLAEALDLVHLLDRPAGRMSGGERRRAHTAAALLHRPPLLLLDEPTVGADFEARERVLAHVQALAAAGTAVCYTTHQLAEVEALAATVAILDRGRLLDQGTHDELVARHGTVGVDLVFTGDPPPLDLGSIPVTRHGNRLRIGSPEPERAAAAALGSIEGSATAGLQAIEIVRPSLEDVYRTVTGRTLAEQEPGTADEPTPPSNRAGVDA